MLSCSPAPQRRNKNIGNGGQNIKVFVRVRPMNDSEHYGKSHCCIEVPPTARDVVVHERPFDKHTKKFSFDKVFTNKSKQLDVYKSVARPLVDEVLNGFNCTIFAYGQTGTGKTYTMEGGFCSDNSPMDGNHDAGIIPRCVNQLFDELRIQKIEFTTRVSFLELYNEDCFDLLSAHDDLSKLRLYEDATRKGSCIIQGLEEVLVRNKSDVYSIIEKGSAKRQTAATLMNAHSSRSHTVFTVTVHMKENTVDGDELVKTGKLHLVDLAGSENIGRSGAVEKRAREAGNINQSLLTLGRVIKSLVEKTPHVPYRESKLTRLLQDALGGRTKTSIIATISPASVSLEETLSTLDYACRAKNIQNRPEVNQKLNKKELIGEYTNEIEKLRRDLLAMREKNGVYLANENYQDMIVTMELQSREITEKISQIKALESEMEKQMEVFTELQGELESTNQKLEATELEKFKTKEALECTQKLLSETATERDEQKHLVTTHVKTEDALHSQATSLLRVTQITTEDVQKLHEKLDRKRKVEELNEDIGSTFEKEIEEKVSAMHSSIFAFKEHHNRTSSAVVNGLGTCMTTSKDDVENLSGQLESMNTSLVEALKKTCALVQQKISDRCDRSSSFSNNLIDQACTNEKLLTQFIEEVFQPLVSSMSEGFAEQERILVDFRENNILKIKALTEYCQSVHMKESEILESLDAPLVEIERIPSIIEKRIKQKSQIIEKVNKAHSLSVKKLANKLLKEVEENERLLLSELPLIPEDEESKLRSVADLSKQVQTGVKNLSDLSDTHRTTIVQKENEIQAFVVDDICKVQSEIEKLEKELSTLQLRVKEQTANHESSLKSIAELANNSRNEEMEKAKLERKGIKKDVQDLCEITSSHCASTNEQLLYANKKVESVLSDSKQRLSHLGSELEEFLTDHNDQLQESGDSIQNFINKELVKDVSTGMTPARTNYLYPETLSATSPHERILNRYRKKLTTISKIPIPAYDREEEEIAASSSKSTPEIQISGALSETSLKSISSSDMCDSKEPGFAFPSLPLRQGSKEEIPRPGSSLSRSSSTNSLPENGKENEITRSRSKRRELKPSNFGVKIHPEAATKTTRARKILGSYN